MIHKEFVSSSFPQDETPVALRSFCAGKTVRNSAFVAVKCVLLSVVYSSTVFAAPADTPPSITFLDKTKGAQAITDETMSPYFKLLQPMEMSAKTGKAITGTSLERQRDECRKRYRDAVTEFTAAEQESIQTVINRLRPVLAAKYPRYGNMPWSFIKVADTIEGGLPHTRGASIVLANSMCEGIRDVVTQARDKNAWLGIADLLLHEQMHVFQRANPGIFDSFYTNAWGFIKTKEIAGCDWLNVHHLANPDAVDCPWVFPLKDQKGNVSYIWPLVVFSDGEGLKMMPDDFRMLGISLDQTAKGFRVLTAKNGVPVATDLKRIPEYRALFPTTTSVYHPEEASAAVFAQIVIWDEFVPKIKTSPAATERSEKAFGALRKWMNANLQATQPPR